MHSHRFVTFDFQADTTKTLFVAAKLTVTLIYVIANALILKHVLTDEKMPLVLYCTKRSLM